jgi:hypothetical protein
MVCVPTTGTHLFSPLTYSYSVPSSVSKSHFSSSLENEMRGSLSKSEGDWGKPEWAGSGEASLSFMASRLLRTC